MMPVAVVHSAIAAGMQTLPEQRWRLCAGNFVFSAPPLLAHAPRGCCWAGMTLFLSLLMITLPDSIPLMIVARSPSSPHGADLQRQPLFRNGPKRSSTEAWRISRSADRIGMTLGRRVGRGITVALSA